MSFLKPNDFSSWLEEALKRPVLAEDLATAVHTSNLKINFNDFALPTGDVGVLFNGSDEQVVFKGVTLDPWTAIYNGQVVDL